ncbi:MAG: C40 family peptidase [Flavobacteriales bacterium]|nr:C40 family peptidase [Flavobacteriales bacterium]
MPFGYCNLSFIPGRAEPSDKSEMTNQVLFGEHFDIIEENDNWFKIKLDHDDYACWVDKKQVLVLSDEDAESDEGEYLVDQVSAYIEDQSSNSELNLVLGSLLPPHARGAFQLGGTKYQFSGAISSYDEGSLESVSEYAYLYLNTPYLWGGRTPFGIDCSGFTQMVFRMCGVALARDSHEQAEEGEAVDMLEEAEEGDLAFFRNEKGVITHVGIIISNPESSEMKIIHASGKVRVDKLDEQGIFNIDTQQYTHRLDRIRSFE